MFLKSLHFLTKSGGRKSQSVWWPCCYESYNRFPSYIILLTSRVMWAWSGSCIKAAVQWWTQKWLAGGAHPHSQCCDCHRWNDGKNERGQDPCNWAALPLERSIFAPKKKLNSVEVPEFEMGSTLVHEILYPLLPSGSTCRIWLDSCWCLALTQVFTHFRSANLRGFHQWPFMSSLYHLVSSCIPFCSSSLSERVQVRLAVTFESGTSDHCIL